MEFQEDIKNLQKECGDDKEKLELEFLDLIKEPVKLDVEPVQFSYIENISTKSIYSDEIISKITI